MKEVQCTRGFGLIADPQTGTEYNVEGDNTVEVDADVAERLKDTHSGIVVSEVETTGSDAEDGDVDGHECGYNGCSRAVDAPDEHCWQHP